MERENDILFTLKSIKILYESTKSFKSYFDIFDLSYSLILIYNIILLIYNILSIKIVSNSVNNSIKVAFS